MFWEIEKLKLCFKGWYMSGSDGFVGNIAFRHTEGLSVYHTLCLAAMQLYNDRLTKKKKKKDEISLSSRFCLGQVVSRYFSSDPHYCLISVLPIFDVIKPVYFGLVLFCLEEMNLCDT